MTNDIECTNTRKHALRKAFQTSVRITGIFFVQKSHVNDVVLSREVADFERWDLGNSFAFLSPVLIR